MADEPITTEGQPEGVDRPEWLPQNFKSPEDLAKSYEESRREMDRLRSQLDEERQQFQTALEQFSVQQHPQPQPQQPGLDPQTQAQLAAYQQAVESGDAAAQLAITLALSQQLNQQAVAAAIDQKFSMLNPELETQRQVDRDNAFRMAELRVANQYGDKWAELAPEVNNWLHNHPAFLPNVNTIDAFEPVIAEAARSVVNMKAAEQLAALQADRSAKLAAQTATGGASGRYNISTDEKKAAWYEIKQAAHTSYSDLARK